MEPTRPLGEILIENGYLTVDQLDEALAQQKQRPDIPLGQLCVSLGHLSQDRLRVILARYGKQIALGEMLCNAGSVSLHQIAGALQEQQRTGQRLGEILIRQGIISEVALYGMLTQQYGIPFVPIGEMNPAAGLKHLVTPVFAAQNRLVPISRLGDQLTVAISDPARVSIMEDLGTTTGLRVTPVLATPSDVATVYHRLYGAELGEQLAQRSLGRQRGKHDTVADRASSAPRPIAATPLSPAAARIAAASTAGRLGGFTSSPDIPTSALQTWTEDSGVEVIEEELLETSYGNKYTTGEDSPLVQNVVQAMIRRALSLRASDIHLEATVNGPRVRLRVDGVLHEHHLGDLHTPFNNAYRSVISRLKILSQLDITERRRPQDGSFRMLARSAKGLNSVDFRVSTLPGRFGEGMVLRILDQTRAPQSLEGLGLSPDVVRDLMAAIHRPTGILLITGPTGSGKSSTLYAALRTIYHPGLKILTAEDPIEYTHPGICQAEVNPILDNTFAKYLRAFLRQDPDVIMVGEIRDSETAEMAMRAAQTGHLLLSTLHTNSSTASVARLLDLEMDPNSIASTLIAIMAQRLVRKVCAECSETYEPEDYLLAEWFEEPPTAVAWKRGRGCGACSGAGYAGRVAVAELWTPSHQEIMMVNKRVSSDELRREALTHMKCLGEDALRKAIAGVTTLDEAFRIVPYEDVVHVRQQRSAQMATETPQRVSRAA